MTISKIRTLVVLFAMVSLRVEYFLLGSYLFCNINAFRGENTRASVEIGSDASFPPASRAATASLDSNLNTTLSTATIAMPTKEALDVFNWVEFLFKSRIDIDQSQSSSYWTADKDAQVSEGILKKLNHKLGIPEKTKIIVRVISGAAAKILGYITRNRWSDLDIWVRGIQAMKEIDLVEKEGFAGGINDEMKEFAEGSLNEELHNMKWRGEQDMLSGTVGGKEKMLVPGTPTIYEKKCITRFQKAVGRLCDGRTWIPNVKEIDAWDPVVEPGKLITKELYNYWWLIHSENPLAGALLKLSDYAFGQRQDSKLFDIYIEGYAAQLAFKIAMMSGARQENHDWKHADDLKENCGEKTKHEWSDEGDVEAILVKTTDVSDLAHTFMRLVQEKNDRDMWNNWVAHARTKDYSKTSPGYQQHWSNLYKKKAGGKEYWSKLARWLKFYRPSKPGQEYWFQYKAGKKQPQQPPFARVPAAWFNHEIDKAISTRHGTANSAMFFERMSNQELITVKHWGFSLETDSYLEIVEVDPLIGKGNATWANVNVESQSARPKRVESESAQPQWRSWLSPKGLLKAGLQLISGK